MGVGCFGLMEIDSELRSERGVERLKSGGKRDSWGRVGAKLAESPGAGGAK